MAYQSYFVAEVIVVDVRYPNPVLGGCWRPSLLKLAFHDYSFDTLLMLHIYDNKIFDGTILCFIIDALLIFLLIYYQETLAVCTKNIFDKLAQTAF